MKHKPRIIALIPARSGSERVKNKNILNFFGHPLLAYAINSAVKTNLFDKIIVSTDSNHYAKIANYYGAEIPFLRPKKISTSISSDYSWIKYTLSKLANKKIIFDYFFILRPVNPFRTSKTIIRAWKFFRKKKNISLRAVELCDQHPAKMWSLRKGFIFPLIKGTHKGQPLYSCQYKTLPKIYVQNASLEISKVNVLTKNKSIAGKKIIPFFTNKYEGLDINNFYDLYYAKYLVKKKILKFEDIKKKSFFKK